jgi:chloride channel 2
LKIANFLPSDSERGRSITFFVFDDFFHFFTFRTDFKVIYPYDPRELIAFAGIGVVCGLGGALYVYVHRRYVLWMRGNKKLTKFLQKNRFIYPFVISLLITGLSFPPLLGQFIASSLNTHDQVSHSGQIIGG